MTAEVLSSIAGIVLSLVFSYVPGISDWFGKLEATYKRLVMLALLVVVGIGVFGVTCWGIVKTGITCDQAGAIGLVKVLVVALVANQSTYLISPRRAE